ncbi:TonB-dependent siderophore receptor [Pseudomonas sp. RP23018S]|uniref:TonB-dependent siderophore receptor n=1 Tax=Pseudomonas sp. RP23018S TaxID=3096037 RepID=UPI002ACA4E57|nr:TonB-dependent siderophore receptor [Pseudomonas sp. RP23018S]MDZ5604325.1 TonB-dependent siderophore receptor [Pseudomonas sp. RP23018S]
MVLGLALGFGSAAQAEPVAVNIPASSLNDALTALARQTGLQLLFEPNLVSGKRSTAVAGTMEPGQALDLLLINAGLTYRIDNGTVIINATRTDLGTSGAAIELDATSISGQGMGEATENSGSYTTGLVSVGSKTPVSLKDTPQTVSIVSKKLIDDTRSTSLADAMKRAPGITLRNANYNTQGFYSRGFGIDNVQIDGAAPMDIGTGVGTFYSERQYDLAAYDHVEILRGASGLLGGTGDPGGIVNLVRKRPMGQYQLKFEASAGSWDNYRSEVDVTGPLAFDGRLRGRMVAAYTDRHYFQDVRATERPFLYGILEADITDDTMLTFGGSYDKQKETGTGDGLPRYSGGGDVHLPRHTWYSTDKAWADSYTREWFAKVDHQFNDDWKLNTSYTYSYNAATTEGINPYGWVDENTQRGTYWWGSYVGSFSKQQVVDVNLSGAFDAFGRRHEVLVGADYQKVDSRWQAAQGMLGKGGYIDLWDPKASPLTSDESNHAFYRDYSPNSRVQYGLYSTLRLQLTDPLKLVVGARAQRYKFEQGYSKRNPDGSGEWTQSSSDTVSDRQPTTLVPYGGLIYALNDQWSTYVSYSEVFKPQSQKLSGPEDSMSSIEPMVGKSYETGIKGELLDGRLNVNAALFYTKRKNQAVTDPTYPDALFSYSASCCFLASDQVTSRGIDLEATGEIAPGWEVMAGYTYNQVRNDTEETLYSSITPKHLFKVWSMYTLPGDFSAWRVGGGVTAQSAAYVNGTAYRTDPVTEQVLDSRSYKFNQAGHAVTDAMVEYQVNDNWSVALNGNNLFDRRYYSTVYSSEYGNYYGEPRNFMLTLRGTFH